VGIDLGIATFATLSDGATYAGLSSFKAHQTDLAKSQRAMSRKTKFSSKRLGTMAC
jgi:putative transposase